MAPEFQVSNRTKNYMKISWTSSWNRNPLDRMHMHPPKKTAPGGALPLRTRLKEGRPLGRSVQVNPSTKNPIAEIIRPIRLVHMATLGNAVTIVSQAITEKPMKMSAIPPINARFLIDLLM